VKDEGRAAEEQKAGRNGGNLARESPRAKRKELPFGGQLFGIQHGFLVQHADGFQKL
jgi:hypothetical protein